MPDPKKPNVTIITAAHAGYSAIMLDMKHAEELQPYHRMPEHEILDIAVLKTMFHHVSGTLALCVLFSGNNRPARATELTASVSFLQNDAERLGYKILDGVYTVPSTMLAPRRTLSSNV